MEIPHRKERERGREEKRKNGELSNRSLKTEGRQTVENLKRNLLKDRGEEQRAKEQEQRSEQQVSEVRREDREQRTYKGIS